MIRTFDFIIACFGLLCCVPIMVILAFIIWLQDGCNPFYFAPRVGKKEKIFTMIKLRSMKINASDSGVDSTASNDNRITRAGKFIRKFKLDELPQLWNVICGDMSFVGPRPNVKKETDIYTSKEKKLLSVRPGITDFASIVFSDEGEILKNKKDPDIAYNQLIRPGKNTLGLFYISNKSFILNLKLLYATLLCLLSRESALIYLNKILRQLNATEELIRISLRKKPLSPAPPPGSNHIVTTRTKKSV